MKEKIEKRSFSGSIKIALSPSKIWECNKTDLAENIIKIVTDYVRQGYVLTLRQLYYQLVASDLIPNHDKVYKKISSVKDDLAYAGLLDWDAIEDRGRVPHIDYCNHNIEHALNDAVDQYKLDRMKNQEMVIEVWTEKDAISNILKRVTRKYHIRLVVNKGYISSSAIYSAYRRFINYLEESKKVYILYFGDHDPSGLDMVRDIEDRMYRFLTEGTGKNSLIDQALNKDDSLELEGKESFFDKYYNDKSCYNSENDGTFIMKGANFDITRAYCKEMVKVLPIGLTMSQIKEYNPPPNPAKITDPRAKEYIKNHGNISWEVDALKPQIMERIVTSNIENIIDLYSFEEIMKQENSDKLKIRSIIDNLNHSE